MKWHPYFREGFWVVAGQAGYLLAMLATIKLLTSFLPPAAYGQFNLILVALLLPSGLLLAPLSQAAIRWYSMAREANSLGSFMATIGPAYFALSVATSLIGLVLLALGLFGWLGIAGSVLVLAIGVFFIDAVISLEVSLASAARRRRYVALITAGTAWIRFFCMFAGVTLFGSSLTVVFAGYFLGGVAVLIALAYPMWREFKPSIHDGRDGVLLKTMVGYGLPFGVWGGFAWLQQYADRYVAGAVIDAATAGAYIASLQVAALPFNLAGTLLSQFLTPIVYEQAGDGRDQVRVRRVAGRLLKIVAVFVATGVPVATAYLLVGEPLMRLLAHANYHLSSTVLLILALASLILNAAQQLTLLLLVQNQSRRLLWAKLFPGIVSFPLAWLFGTAWGVTGISVAYCIVSIVFAAIVIFQLRALTTGAPMAYPR